KILDSGVQQVEVTSFVHPKSIPQMYDSEAVAKAAVEMNKNDARLIALVPNLKGAENALKSGITTVSYVISASEAHNMNNVNRTVQQSIDNLKELAEAYPQLDIRLDVATAFGCPFEGDVPLEKILRVTDAGIEAGVKEIILCDTIGIANPKQVYKIVNEVKDRYDLPIGLHIHDTRGMGLACIVAGVMAGIDTYETSIGGLGGCPFAPGAAGNTATEDMLNMFAEMGVETGIDFDRYMEAVRFVKDNICHDLTGRMVNVFNK
ncbi:MAG: hydroxymethylglutaryl-CoA lyase, partial [Anaerovoracaceae bacterium]